MSALTRLRIAVQATEEPLLSDAELASVLDECARVDGAGNSHRNVSVLAGPWASGSVLFGLVIEPVAGQFFRCVVPGLTGATQPNWPSNLTSAQTGQVTVHDGDVVWQFNGTAWAESYDLELAKALAWELKAAKAAGQFDFTADNQSFRRSQVWAHCIEQSQAIRRRRLGMVGVASA